ncbi:hypothetical protein KJZ61_04620 [Candidatus Dependentiae bacterium]|nr:hypothetical protein [Candidatus Dependentiae bacterium]
MKKLCYGISVVAMLMANRSVMSIHLPDELRYNETTWLVTHNATSFGTNLWDIKDMLDRLIDPVYFIPIYGQIELGKKLTRMLEQVTRFNLSADQHHSLEQQYANGIHAFKIPIHTYGDTTPMIMHTQSYNERDILLRWIEHNVTGKTLPFRKILEDKATFILQHIDRTRIPLHQFLTRVVQLLEQDPEAIITLFSDVHIAPEAQRNFIRAFYESGAYNYLHIQAENQPWPLLGTLRKTNKRLITFFDEKFSEELLAEFPWARGLHGTNRFIAANHWTFESLEKLISDSGSIGSVGVDRAMALYLMYHFVTPRIAPNIPGISGSAPIARVANSYPVLNVTIDKFRNKNGKTPNFIAVDFYDENYPDLRNIVDQINFATFSSIRAYPKIK